MTLEGARRCLKQNKTTISRDAELLERLQRVRAMLEEVRAELRDGAQALSDEESAARVNEPESPSESPVQVIERGPRRKSSLPSGPLRGARAARKAGKTGGGEGAVCLL